MKYSFQSRDNDPNSINKYLSKAPLNIIHAPIFTVTEPDHQAGRRKNHVIYTRYPNTQQDTQTQGRTSTIDRVALATMVAILSTHHYYVLK